MRVLAAVTVITASLSLTAQAATPERAAKHDRDVIRFFLHHPKLAAKPAGQRALWRLLHRFSEQIRTLQAVPSDCRGASSEACAWYLDGATQCEVAHEGGWTSLSPDGTYAGRFQMDSSFEAETKFGAAMQARYGRANNWPPWAQIAHAFEVWLYSGWSRWPPYYKYGCAAYHGGSYA